MGRPKSDRLFGIHEGRRGLLGERYGLCEIQQLQGRPRCVCGFQGGLPLPELGQCDWNSYLSERIVCMLPENDGECSWLLILHFIFGPLIWDLIMNPLLWHLE